MVVIANIDDVLVHRQTSCEYRVMMRVFDESHLGQRGWRFQVREVGAEPPCQYWLGQKDIGIPDSSADFYIKEKEGTH